MTLLPPHPRALFIVQQRRPGSLFPPFLEGLAFPRSSGAGILSSFFIYRRGAPNWCPTSLPLSLELAELRLVPPSQKERLEGLWMLFRKALCFGRASACGGWASGSRSQGPRLGSPQRVQRYCHLRGGWNAWRDFLRAPATGTMGGRRGRWWASARSRLEVEEAGERGAGPRG